MPRRGFNNLGAVVRSIPRGAEAIVEKATVDIAAGAGANAPIDTGALAESYTADVRGLEGEAGTNMEYGPYVEYGTERSGAQPHLVPAADAVEDAMGRYARDLGIVVEKAARRG